MKKLMNKIIAVHSKANHAHQQLMGNDKGATMIEYTLVVAAVVALAATFFGNGGQLVTAIQTALTNAVTAIGNATPTP